MRRVSILALCELFLMLEVCHVSQRFPIRLLEGRHQAYEAKALGRVGINSLILPASRALPCLQAFHLCLSAHLQEALQASCVPAAKVMRGQVSLLFILLEAHRAFEH